ncbi:MAG: class I SAM-dependent methyltransferase [Rhabdochlamydiaceae bacterium]
MNKLNIGCGNVLLKEYLNCDKYYYPGSLAPLNDNALADSWNQEHPDSSWIQADAKELPYQSDYFDEVLMVHVIEHLSMEDGNRAVKEAARVCKPGGFVEIETPDLIVACKLMIETDKEVDSQHWYRVMGLLHGTTGMDGEGQFHLCGYSENYLRKVMTDHNLINIERIPVGFGHGNNGEGHPEPQYDFRLRGYKK